MGKPDAQRRASFPSSSAENVLANVDKPLKQTSAALVKHGKYVLVGAAGCWYTGLYGVAKSIWASETDWIKWVLVASVAAHTSTVLIFLYLVFFLPYIRGYIPNYPKWQESARMRVIVPMLTSSILAGWVGYVVALSQAGKRSPLHALGDGVLGLGEGSLERMKGGKGLGIVSSIVGTTSLYVLTLGLLGFIQAPAGTPVRKKQA